MSSVLIVDDEIIVIRAIQKGVQWEALGIETIYTAREVRGAQAILEAHPVDVVLCDIEMPHASGLELVGWLHEKLPEIVVLLLTGHADFEYAREAISLGVFEYLLKPVVYKQLQEKIALALDAAARRRKDMAIQNAWKDNQESLMADYLRAMVRDETVYSREEMHQISLSYHLEFLPQDMFLAVYIRAKALDAHGESREGFREFLSYVRRLFTLEDQLFYLLNPWEETVVVLYQIPEGRTLPAPAARTRQGQEDPDARPQPLGALPENTVRERAVELTQLAYTYGNFSASCYISELFQLSEMNLMLRKLKERSENNVIYDRKVFLVSRLNTSAKKPEPARLDTQKWIGQLEAGQFDQLIVSVDFTLHHLVISGEMDKERLTQVYSVFMQMIYYFMKTHEYPVFDVFDAEALSRWQQQAVKSVEDFRRFIRYVTDALENHKRRSQNADSLVGRAKKYIDEHISEDMSRESIAEHVALSENYLSKIFKRETGYSISDYLLMRRMARAKSLLIETARPVGEIAMEVGYSNSAYFIKMFKRETGKTPNEYRREMRI